MVIYFIGSKYIKITVDWEEYLKLLDKILVGILNCTSSLSENGHLAMLLSDNLIKAEIM